MSALSNTSPRGLKLAATSHANGYRKSSPNPTRMIVSTIRTAKLRGWLMLRRHLERFGTVLTTVDGSGGSPSLRRGRF